MNQRIGNYRVIKKIGTGSFADVVLAVHTTLDKKVAIKKINCKKIKIKKNFHACEREITIYKTFDHPNIIKVFDIINKNALLCIVMEYAKKGDLLNVISEHGKLKEKQVRFYFRQLINGLEYAHLRGYTHRDLKLENILLTENNYIKITDFGLADKLRNGKFFKTCCGTIRYADPEILREKPYCGELCDIWSCGIILFTLLCGYLPFDDDVFGIILKKMMISEFVIPGDISEDAKDLIQNLLKPEVNRRLTLQEIKSHKWFVYEDLEREISLNFMEIEFKKMIVGKIDVGIVKKLKEIHFPNKNIDERELVVYLINNNDDYQNEFRDFKDSEVFYNEEDFKSIIENKFSRVIRIIKTKANCNFNAFKENIDLIEKDTSLMIVDYYILQYLKKLKKNKNMKEFEDKNSSSYLFSDFSKILKNEKNLEFFTNLYQFFNIMLGKNTLKINWTFGIQSKLRLEEIIKKIVKLFNTLKIKIDVGNAEEYYLKCYLVDEFDIKTKKYFDVRIYDNFDEFTIDLKNHNINNLKFVLIVQKIMGKFNT